MRKHLFFLIIIILSGCAGAKYSAKQDPGADFDTIKTFFCAECGGEVITMQPRYDNERNRTIFREAIISEMVNRGYSSTDEKPDVLLEYLITVENKVDTVVQRTTSYRYWRGFETDAYNYKKGIILINMINRESGLIMWQGKAESVLDKDPKNQEKRIVEFVERIFKYFPVKAID